MGTPGGTAPLALDYAPPPPSRWRRRIRLLVILLLVAGAGLAARRWGPPLWKRTQLLYSQRQCLNYSPSPDRVVYEGNPELAKSLMTQSDYSRPTFLNRALIPSSTTTPVAVHRTERWDQFLGLASLTLTPSGVDLNRGSPAAICFLGELRTPSGEPRLVMVECHPTAHRREGGPVGTISGFSVTPGGIFSPGPATVMEHRSWRLGNPFSGEPANLRIYAGQRDPKDSSRFSFRYRVHGVEGVVNGSIDDLGGLHLQSRSRGAARFWAPPGGAFPFPNTVAADVLLWGPGAWKRQLLQAQRASLNHTAPPDQMVYTDVRSTYATGIPSGYRRYMLGIGSDPILAWSDLMTLAGIPHPLVRGGDPGSFQPSVARGTPQAACFLGELSTASGLRKLVVVDCVPVIDAMHGGRSPMSMILQAFSVEPGSHLTPPGPLVVSPSVARLTGGWEGGSFNLTIYAGQRDPADPSRFTIRYTVGERTAVVQGRLAEDGHVDFTPSDRLDRWPYRGP